METPRLGIVLTAAVRAKLACVLVMVHTNKFFPLLIDARESMLCTTLFQMGNCVFARYKNTDSWLGVIVSRQQTIQTNETTCFEA